MKKLFLSALAAVATFSAFAADYELVTSNENLEVGNKAYLSQEKNLLSGVATPTIDPDGGHFITVNGDVEVNISCETEGATIYYTIDGEEPNTTSEEYYGPFSISTDITETIIISAIAVKDDMSSQIATATLNFCRPYESLSELLAEVTLPEENKAYSDIFAVGFTSIVALAHGSYIYITDYDSSYYSLIYKSGTGLTAGNMIYPYWLAKVQNYNGTYEIIPEGDFYGDTDVTEPLEFEEIYDLGSVGPDKINHVVVLKEIQITEATPGPDATGTALNFNVTQNESTYVFRNNFKIASTEPGTYDVLAAVAQYNGEIQFYPAEYRMPQTAAPEISTPNSGLMQLSVVGDKFTLTYATEGATIYYTETEGGDWIEYTEPLTMEHNISIYAKATAPGHSDSEVQHFTQTVCVHAPEASISGDANPGTRITLSCETPGTTFFYGFFKTEAELNNLMPNPYYGSIAIPETFGELYLTMTSGILDENWDNVLTPDTNPYSDDILYPNMNIVAYTVKPYVTPENLYIFGNIDGNNWNADQPLAFEKEGNVFTYCGTIDGESFGITELIGSDNSTRWGGSLSDEQAINANEATRIVRSANATMTLPQGSYKFEVTFTDNLATLTVSEWSGIDRIDTGSAAKTEYYNLQGVRVANPSDGGVYIIRRGNTVSKEIVSKK